MVNLPVESKMGAVAYRSVTHPSSSTRTSGTTGSDFPDRARIIEFGSKGREAELQYLVVAF
jgi:hypothetical protein